MSLFGDRKSDGMPWLADMVMIEYAKNNPHKVSGGSAHSRKKRGSVNLGSYLHVHGAKRSKVSGSKRPKFDKELYIGRMKSLRGWDALKSTQE